MDFSSIKKWMLKMNNILEVYSNEDSFTQSEKNLLLDYNSKIREAIKTIVVEDSEADNESSEIPGSSKQEISTNKSSGSQPVLQSPKIEEVVVPKNDYHLYKELFLFKKVEDLSEKLESTPISNIQKSMGLNERILTQNELFGGEKNAFDTAIQKLNAMDRFDEVESYLCEEIIPKYDWMNEARIKKAQWFIKFIKRKFS